MPGPYVYLRVSHPTTRILTSEGPNPLRNPVKEIRCPCKKSWGFWGKTSVISDLTDRITINAQ